MINVYIGMLVAIRLANRCEKTWQRKIRIVGYTFGRRVTSPTRICKTWKLWTKIPPLLKEVTL